MAKIGNYKFPVMKLSEAINVVSKIIKDFNGEISVDGLANILSMTKTGGSFINKTIALKNYNLVSGRNTLIATELAKRIVLSPDPVDKEEAGKEAYLNIPLIRDLLKKFNYTLPSKDNFAIALRDLTKADLIIVKKRSTHIFKLYNEALEYSKKSGKATVSQVIGEQFREVTKETEEMLDARLGNIYIKVPKSVEQIEMAEKLLEMLKSQVKKKEKSSKIEESEVK